MTATLSFFPVCNGDMTLIELDNGQTILIDCNIRQAADADDDDTLDVATELKKRLKRDANGRLFVSAMVLSHPDQDHCAGLENHFHLGDPAHWVQDDDKILINEMWSSPVVFRRASKTHTLVAAAQAWGREARRRVQRYRDHGIGDAGDRIKILGEDENGKTDDLGAILVEVEGVLQAVDAGPTGAFEAQLLGPLPTDHDEEAEEALAKNRSSIILRFSLCGDGQHDAGRFLTGGDAEVAVWRSLWDLHGGTRPEWLSYDMLLAPHHCSWHSLSDDSWSDMGNDATVDADARAALAQARDGAVVVSSSKEVKDDDSDPPCIRAKREYVAIVGGDGGRFYCTGDLPGEVLEFCIGALGPEKKARTLKSASVSLGVGATSRTPRDHGA